MITLCLPDREIELSVPSGIRLLDALRKAGLDIYSPCAGRGVCGKCKVKIEGYVSPLTPVEIEHITCEGLREGVRLACQVILEGDTTVQLLGAESPLFDDTTIVMEGQVPAGQWDPRVQAYPFHPDFHALDGSSSDWDRIIESLDLSCGRRVPVLSLARRLPEVKCEHAGSLRERSLLHAVFLDDEVLDIVSEAPEPFGVALDIGTTTVVAYLVNLKTGESLGAIGSMNPQACYGADIISRITCAGTNEGLLVLQKEIVDTVNDLIRKLATEYQISLDQIYLVSAVGNTCMHHLFLGISPKHLGKYPYSPVVRDLGLLLPSEVGLMAMNRRGRFFFLPNIGGFIGSDILGVAIACGISEQSKPTLIIDIGTNGEIMLAGKGRLLTCSAAAGPALEGVNISCGMVASRGAIDHVWLTRQGGREDIGLGVIGNCPPRGICGSGLISLVAVLREVGIISESGKLARNDVDFSTPLGRRLIQGDEGTEFVLCSHEYGCVEPGSEHVPPVTLTQRDTREFQLAKGAIRAGVEILLSKLELSADDLDSIILAGAFGARLDKRAPIEIGLLPPSRAAQVISAGNAAGEGSKRVLMSKSAYDETLRIYRIAEHIELGACEGFQDILAESMFLIPK